MAGTPEQVARDSGSYTGQFLQRTWFPPEATVEEVAPAAVALAAS